MPSRTISVGISRLFRIVEVDGTIAGDYEPNLTYRIEQAVRSALTRKWEWHARASASGRGAWMEAHGALHAMQAALMDKMRARQGGTV